MSPRRGPHNSAITWTPHLKVAWGGTLGGSGEIWTNSLRYLHGGGAETYTAAQIVAMEGPLWSAIGGWFGMSKLNNSPYPFIGNEATLTWLKVNNILATGLQVAGDTNLYAGTPRNGTDQNPVPYYQTFAITLRTALKRGRAHAGRIFPPLVQPLLVSGTGQCSVDDATFMAQAFRDCMLGMQTAIRTNGSVGSFAVFSPGDSTKGTVPIANPIVSVTVEQTPDVQHRRTNRILRKEGVAATVSG